MNDSRFCLLFQSRTSIGCLQAMEDVVQRYRNIPPFLKKIEELLDGTSSGKSPGQLSASTLPAIALV